MNENKMVGLFMKHGAHAIECTMPNENESDICQI